jgi:galactitol-specific phosphotransferase system IIB component
MDQADHTQAVPVNQAATILLAIIAACGAAVVTGIFTRPKVSADARSSNINADVSLSADARAWAMTFQEQATRAEKRADAAEKRADEVEVEAVQAREAAEACNERCDAMEIKLNLLMDYTTTLQGLLRVAEQPTRALRPPL